jgi:hypothetical protein
MKMPFADGTFDGAYSIEATCHGALLVRLVMLVA